MPALRAAERTRISLAGERRGMVGSIESVLSINAPSPFVGTFAAPPLSAAGVFRPRADSAVDARDAGATRTPALGEKASTAAGTTSASSETRRETFMPVPLPPCLYGREMCCLRASSLSSDVALSSVTFSLRFFLWGWVIKIPGAPPAPAGVPRLPPLANSAADDGAVAASPVAATRKQKGRSKQKHVSQDVRKRQRRADLLLTSQDNTEAGT